MIIPVFFSNNMVADSGHEISPSSKKPAAFVSQLGKYPVEIFEPTPVTKEDFYRVHYKDYVDGVFNLIWKNGFDNFSPDVAKSLPYTTGAMLCAARKATKEVPAIAPVSGFHHAEFHGGMGFCTFNGLMVTAHILMEEGKKVAIVDCDQHYGNGTDDIIGRLCLDVYHLTFGKYYKTPKDSLAYLKRFKSLEEDLINVRPDVILYQAGADSHKDDPYGGVLDTVEMKQRDRLMFTIAKKLGIPLCWNLAGGYQVEKDGSFQKVIDLHLNTVDAALEIYS
jgi:acetoin utilization deacetylase AcuC-like enzyme